MSIELTESLSPGSSVDVVTNTTKTTSDHKETTTSEESTCCMTSTTEHSTATASRCLTSLLDMNEGYEMVIWDRVEYDYE